MFQQNFTPFVRNVLIASFAIYLVQLASRGLIDGLLGWYAFGAGFAPWQPITSFFLTGPDPRSAVSGWLGLFFFLAPVHSALGTRKLGFAVLAVWAAVVVSTLGLVATGLLGFTPHIGYLPIVMALVCYFGFYYPTQNILLMFVLPVRGIWFAWGSGIYALLWVVYAPSSSTWMDVAAWLGAFAFQFFEQGGWRRFRNQQQRKRVERRFAVHPGGRGNPDWDN